MKHLTFATCLLALCLIPTVVSATPLSLMTQEELQALPDAMLEENGFYRVKPGETTWSLSRQAGLSVKAFHSFNRDAYRGGPEEKLPAGAVVKVGNLVESSKVIAAGTFGGRHSIHEYEFCGCRDASTDLPTEVQVRWSVEWPEEGCGLLPKGLKNLQNIVISSCFGSNDAISGDGVQPSEMSTIEEAEALFKRLAHEDFSYSDLSSRWEFIANGEFSWPFGMTWKGDKWYQRPVIVFKNFGYSNNRGNGCHEYFRGYVVSIPDGVVLTEHDYFREDTLDELATLVGKRLDEENNGDSFAMNGSTPKVRTGEDCWLTVSEEGMTWWCAPYSFFGGVCGVTNVTIPWDELEPFYRVSRQASSE